MIINVDFLIKFTQLIDNLKVTFLHLGGFIYPLLKIFLCFPKIFFGGAYCRCCVRPSVCPSSYLLNLSSEINVVDNKCFFRLGLVDKGHSRSFWKVQGQSEHIMQRSNFNISSFNNQRSSETYT
jgi:hypothetical protein